MAIELSQKQWLMVARRLDVIVKDLSDAADEAHDVAQSGQRTRVKHAERALVKGRDALQELVREIISAQNRG